MTVAMPAVPARCCDEYAAANDRQVFQQETVMNQAPCPRPFLFQLSCCDVWQLALTVALVALSWGAGSSVAAAQTIVPAGQTIDQFNLPANLGELRMEGGRLILRQGVSTATGSTLSNGLITAPGLGLQLELYADTTVPGGNFTPPFPADGMYISASAAEVLFPLDVVNKGQVFQTGNGKLTLGGGARFINDQGSTYWIRNDLGVERTSDLASASFVNRGSVIKGGTGAGTGTSLFRVPVAQDGGKFETWQGAIQFGRGGVFNDAAFFADGLGVNPVQNGIIFNSSSTFTGIVTTETGSFLLTDRSGITLGNGPLLDFWEQKANFRVDGFESLIDIAAGATLNNTGTLETAFGGALIGGATGPVEQGAPTRGRLQNARGLGGLTAGTFAGVILGERLDPSFPPDFPQFRLIDVQNDRGGGVPVPSGIGR